MDPTGVRTWYVDSRHCEEQDDGSFQLNLYENIELSEGQACYIDDLTIVGTQMNVSSNNRLLLYEYTPTNFNFVGEVKSYNPTDLNRYQLNTLQVTAFAGTDRFSQAYKCDMPDVGGAVYFDIDDTQLNWQGGKPNWQRERPRGGRQR